MAFEQRDMSGSLFKNKDKEDGDKRPNAKGSCMIDGVEYWVDAWTKQGDKGPWQSLAFKRKEKQSGPQRAPAVSDEDSAPF
jgi:hypothetical protein